MKYIILALFMSISSISIAQSDTTFTEDEIISIATRLKNNQDTITHLYKVINNLNTQIDKYTELVNSHSMIDSMRISQITVLKNTVDVMKDVYVQKPWYKSQEMYFVYGMVTMFSAAYAVSRL